MRCFASATLDMADQTLIWHTPRVLFDSDPSSGGLQMVSSLAGDGNGKWVMVGAMTPDEFSTSTLQVFYSLSSNDGSDWSAPFRMPMGGSKATADADDIASYIIGVGPQIEADTMGHWVMTWQENDGTQPNDGPIQRGFRRPVVATAATEVLLLEPATAWSEPQHFAEVSGVHFVPKVLTDRGGTWLLYSAPDGGGIPPQTAFISTSNGILWNGPTTVASPSVGAYKTRFATDGRGNWMMIQQDQLDQPGGGVQPFQVAVRRSTDISTPFGFAPLAFPQTLDPDESYSNDPNNPNTATQPGNDVYASVSTDGRGPSGQTWIATWSTNGPSGVTGADADIMFARSFDNGAHWGAARPLNMGASTDSAQDILPEIVAGGSLIPTGPTVWLCAWSSAMPGSDSDILLARSTDNGRTWSSPKPLNDDATHDTGKDQDFFPQLANDGNGNWVAIWTRSSTAFPYENNAQIFVSTSSDNGQTWSPKKTIGKASGRNGANARITTNKQGLWLISWHSPTHGGSGLDAYCAWAITPPSPRKIGTMSWSMPIQIDDLPSDDYNPAPKILGNGDWIVAWQALTVTNSVPCERIFVSRSGNQGTSWSIPQAISPPNSCGLETFPHLIDDNKGNLLLLWNSELPEYGGSPTTDFELVSCRSTDGGVTWNVPAPVNLNAYDDAGGVPVDYFSVGDGILRAATDRNGHWVVVWGSNEDANLSNASRIKFARTGDGICVPESPSAAQISLYIAGLPPDTFDSVPDQRKSDFVNYLGTVQDQTDSGAISDAIETLTDILLPKTDGCLGGNPNDDWITDCDAQTVVCQEINALIAQLQQ